MINILMHDRLKDPNGKFPHNEPFLFENTIYPISTYLHIFFTIML